MSDTDERESLQLQLAAHRQTLSILLVQRAEFGAAYAPPVVLHGISAARSAIDQLKTQLRSHGLSVDDHPDDAGDRVSGQSPSLSPALARSSGDVIIGTVGDGAQHIAIGKDITQVSGASAPRDAAAQRHVLLAAWAALRPALDPATAQLAGFQIDLLAAELERLDPPSAPSSSAVIRCADWLLANLPQLAQPLAALLRAPAVVGALSRTSADYAVWLASKLPPAR